MSLVLEYRVGIPHSFSPDPTRGLGRVMLALDFFAGRVRIGFVLGFDSSESDLGEPDFQKNE